MHRQPSPPPSCHELALSLARQVEALLADTCQPGAHPRARIAKALAQSLVDEIAALELDPTFAA